MRPLLLIALAGCSRIPLEHGELSRHETLDHDGIERSFHLYASSSKGPRPLVVLLHGGYATIDAVIGWNGGAAPFAGGFLQAAEDEGLHLVIPQGIDKHWNDCRADCDPCPDTNDASFLLSLIDHVSSRLDVDPTHVHMAGESNGGFMTQRMALEHGDRFGGLGVIIASEPANNECADIGASVPLMYVVGTADAAIPFSGGASSSDGTGVMQSSDATLAKWAERNGCTPDPSSTPIKDLDAEDEVTMRRDTWTCTKAPLQRLVANGGGHVVPSISEPVSKIWEGVVGPQSHDIETARELWDFFAQTPSSP